jgi:hypothetical protein
MSRSPLAKARPAALLLACLAGALLAGCAAQEAKKADMAATPYVREPEKPPVRPASKVGGAPSAASSSAPGAPGDAGELRYVETDDESPVLVEGGAEAAEGAPRALALVRVDEGRIVEPGQADLEALAPSRAGTGGSLGAPRALPLERIASLGSRPTLRGIRGLAGASGAPRLLVVHFLGKGERRALAASLHEVASGEVLARYGPGEPSLTLAAALLHRVVAAEGR